MRGLVGGALIGVAIVFALFPLRFATFPVLTYPFNLICHARGGDYFWNNPIGMGCVNAEAWRQEMFGPTKQRFWATYRNEHLDDFGNF